MSNCCATDSGGVVNKVEQTVDYCAAPGRQTKRARATQVSLCPRCGNKGKKVGMETVKAMLAITLHTIRPESRYLFCRTVDCDVVYFADDGAQTFTKAQLREKVYQKHPDDDDVLVCYCFRHTPGSIRAELLETGQSTVVETVTAGTRNKQCACEIRNPQGNCCLGNLRAAVKRMQQEVEAVTIM